MREDIERDLPMQVVDTLRDAGETVALAESCTGGMVGATITAVPGASDVFVAGLTTYTNDAKRRFLGVRRETLDAHGAVSAETACEMAQGARDGCDATWGVSITGIAGPTGGTEEKPVGTVFVGLAYAGPWGSERSYVTADRHEFGGDRSAVRSKTTEMALETVLEACSSTDR